KGFDTVRAVEILANVSQKAFGKNIFGFFEQVRKEKFGKGYRGTFRHASGPEPFIRASRYEGSESFAEGELFVVNSEKNVGLPLQALVFWDDCSNHPDLSSGHCYFFDKGDGDDVSFSYKAAGYPCTINVTLSEGNMYKEIAKALLELKRNDPNIELMKD